jgi:hypothetical protein
MVPSAIAEDTGIKEIASKAKTAILNISSMKKSQVYMN